jgi:hypothetical protein
MLFEYLIIVAYFFASAIPVAVVYMFYRIDTDPETAGMIPEADTYRLPDEGAAEPYLPPGREDGEHPTAELPQRRRGAEENNGENREALSRHER